MYEALEGFYLNDPTLLLLWDLSEAEMGDVTPEILRGFVHRGAELGKQRPGGRTALIAAGDLLYGLGRMSEVFFEMESPQFKFRVFRSRPEASAWLASE